MTDQISITRPPLSPPARIFWAPTIASGKLEAKIATRSVALLLSSSPTPIARFSGRPSRVTAAKQREADAEPRFVPFACPVVEPGVDDDEDRRPGQERRARPPCSSVLERVLEELEGDCGDERPRSEGEQRRRDLAGRRVVRPDPTPDWEGDGGDNRVDDRLAHAGSLDAHRLSESLRVVKKIRLEMELGAPVEGVFEAMTDHGRYDRFRPISASELIREGAADRNGVGAVRRLRAGLLRFDEEITAYEWPRRLDYRDRRRERPARARGRLDPV